MPGFQHLKSQRSDLSGEEGDECTIWVWPHPSSAHSFVIPAFFKKKPICALQWFLRPGFLWMEEWDTQRWTLSQVSGWQWEESLEGVHGLELWLSFTRETWGPWGSSFPGQQSLAGWEDTDPPNLRQRPWFFSPSFSYALSFHIFKNLKCLFLHFIGEGLIKFDTSAALLFAEQWHQEWRKWAYIPDHVIASHNVCDYFSFFWWWWRRDMFSSHPKHFQNERHNCTEA